METAAGTCRLVPGSIYYIPSHHMVRQTCEKEMTVYWINFVSESYYLHYRLLGIRQFHAWPVASVPWIEKLFKRLPELFDQPAEPRPHLLKDASLGLTVKVEGALMHLLGDLIELTDSEFHWENFETLERLMPAIEFMDQNYLRNPSMAEISEKVRLVPRYFQQIFKSHAGITAFAYMENRRMDLARKLIFDKQLSIKEIAGRSGYKSLNYFSRAFRRRFGVPPSTMRDVARGDSRR